MHFLLVLLKRIERLGIELRCFYSSTAITLGISPACKLKMFLSFLLNCFPMPAFVALLLTRRLVVSLVCTDREPGSHHVREGCSQNDEYVAFLARKVVERY